MKESKTSVGPSIKVGVITDQTGALSLMVYSTMELSVRSSTQPASGTGSSSGLPLAPCKSYLWRMYAHAFA